MRQTLEHELVALSHKRPSEPACPHSRRVASAEQGLVALSHKVLNGGLDGCLVHQLGQAPENGRVCFGWHSVPKVEYMTRPPSGTVEDTAGLGLDSLPGREQNRRVE